MITKNGQLLRIFIKEDTKCERILLYEWIVKEARKQKLAGATVFRGFEGFGEHLHMHSNKILSISQGLPITIEIVDEKKKIQEFLHFLKPYINEGLATVKDVEINYFCDKTTK